MGRLTHTRTNTRYFTEEDVTPAQEAVAALRADAEHRRPHIDEDAWAAMDARLTIAETALAMLSERVPE